MNDVELLRIISNGESDSSPFLDLSYKGRLRIPAEIGLLSHLKQLDLRGSWLVALPPEIGQLKSLEHLDLMDTQLEALPPEIGNLRNLRRLELENNNLTTLPSEIGQLTNLRLLVLNNNKITELPRELGKLSKLSNLNIEDNPLISPPPEIVAQGTKAILAYLREQAQERSQQWVSKLLVVGEGGVGKTSLLRALRGETFNPQESTTHGIEVRALPAQHPQEHDTTMYLNTWDFGGQEIYHATHQFFLTNRSLFLLVWNARHGFEQGRLYYWLDTIKARAPESPVLLVATHVDERPADIPFTDLSQKYPQITGHFEVSNKDGYGINVLHEAIARAAASLPLMGEFWPTSWLNSANDIRAEKLTHITPYQLRSIMAKYNVSRDSMKVLSQWLHELGDILYFEDDDELNDIVILDPQWVTQSISMVLNSDEVIKRQGVFTREHMDELWQDIDPSMRAHFLRLMEKFDLSYRTLEDRDISLVVERLRLDPPDYESQWQVTKESGLCRELAMKYELNTTMPDGIPTWFIARSHRFTTHTHWRYGALFTDGPERKHLGLIRASPYDRSLTLTVRGPMPHNFFTLLKDGLDLTLNRFPGIDIKRKVPCPGHNGEACVYDFDFSQLQKAVEKTPPVLEIQCHETLESVSVSALIFGLHWNIKDEVLLQLEDLKQSSVERDKELIAEMQYLKYGMNELRELAQREFTKIFHREQSKPESYCPNIFVLRPADGQGWLRSVLNQKMHLQLFCHAPGKWHPTPDGGLYEIDKPNLFIKAVAPYVQKMAAVLKYTAPLVGPWLGMTSPDFGKAMEKDIKLMEELVKKLPDVKSSSEHDTAEPTDGTLPSERIEGAALRTLRKLLDRKDPQQQWGGLKKVLTPEGHYLWLCPYHAAEYAR